MNERIKALAEQAGVSFHRSLGATYTYGKLSEILERFAELVRDDEREAILCLYSLDGTAADWADKIVARGKI